MVDRVGWAFHVGLLLCLWWLERFKKELEGNLAGVSDGKPSSAIDKD
jgi:hypothetical protein